jgi:hypothetical protein
MPCRRKTARKDKTFREQGIKSSSGWRQIKENIFSLLTFENNYSITITMNQSNCFFYVKKKIVIKKLWRKE